MDLSNKLKKRKDLEINFKRVLGYQTHPKLLARVQEEFIVFRVITIWLRKLNILIKEYE